MQRFVRYRCYFCGDRHRIAMENFVEAVKAMELNATNTILCLCEVCEDEFRRILDAEHKQDRSKLS